MRLLSFITFLVTTLFWGSISVMAEGSITDYELETSEVIQYEKAVFSLTVDDTFSNPYDQREVKINMILTSPSGEELLLPVFFDEENEAYTNWKAHFAPQESGEYTYYFELSTDENLSETTTEGSFEAQASDADGILVKNENHPTDQWTITHNSGKPFRGVGINVGWEGRTWDPEHYTYDYFFERLSENGVNFVRTWMHAWNLPLEWKQISDETDRYSDSDEYFNPEGIQRMDETIDLAEEHDIYLMLALDAHGGFIIDSEWPINNYNSENGGPADTPEEFFTNSEAKEMYKNRLRYLVARWGYSPAIGVWEFFNEVDNVRDAEGIPDFHIFQWHNEMSTYLKSIDPYDHIVSTSISHNEVNNLFSVNDIDINQKHVYRETHRIPEILNDHDTGRPFVIGEFGREWDWDIDFSTIEDEKIYDYKRGLWYGLFNPTPILPMSWWWEWFDERDLFEYFEGVRLISDKMLEAGSGDFEQIDSSFPSESYAVKTDSVVFAYINNIDTEELSGETLSVTVGDAYLNYEAQLFNPETVEFEELGEIEQSNDQLEVDDLNLQGWEQMIFIFTPTEASDTPPTNGEQPQESFELHGNYPNPFNSTTNIKFSVYESSGLAITINVYNAIGKQVKTLVESQHFSQGEYSIPFDPQNLPSGPLFYNVQSHDFNKHGKMMYLR